jgi:threonine/homoserine/homoserine lactone efflux protein
MITNFYLFLISVVVISLLSGVLIPGPVFVVTVAKGYRNRYAGALIAFGHGIIEFPLMALIYFGFGQFFALGYIRDIIALVGGIALIYIGSEMFKIRKEVHEEGVDLPYSSVAAGIITTGSNPYFFLWWATIGATLIINAIIFGAAGFVFFAVVHWLCDFFWYLFVSMMVFKSRRIWSEKMHKLVFGACGLLLILFGARFIISVFQ